MCGSTSVTSGGSCSSSGVRWWDCTAWGGRLPASSFSWAPGPGGPGRALPPPLPALGPRGLAHGRAVHGAGLPRLGILLPGSSARLLGRDGHVPHPLDTRAGRYAAAALWRGAPRAAARVVGSGRSGLPRAAVHHPRPLHAEADGIPGPARGPPEPEILMAIAPAAPQEGSPVRWWRGRRG